MVLASTITKEVLRSLPASLLAIPVKLTWSFLSQMIGLIIVMWGSLKYPYEACNMVRSINDNPGGWSKTLPGHTVEFDSSYALPWTVSYQPTIPAYTHSPQVLTVADDDFIYFVDMISCTSWSYSQFILDVFLNGVMYVSGAFAGWGNIPLRQNPSLQFIKDDVITVTVYNLTAVQQTYNLILNGTKIPKPPGFAHGAF
jgi:hypothetical protein